MKDCTNCRFHRKEERPKSVDVAFDTLIEESDETVPFYFCRANLLEREIGLVPITCEMHEGPSRSDRLAELDAMLSRRNRTPCDD